MIPKQEISSFGGKISASLNTCARAKVYFKSLAKTMITRSLPANPSHLKTQLKASPAAPLSEVH